MNLDSKLPDSGSREKRVYTLLRDVFESTRKLVSGLSGRIGFTFEVEDLQGMLGACGIPCVQGEWDVRPDALVPGSQG